MAADSSARQNFILQLGSYNIRMPFILTCLIATYLSFYYLAQGKMINGYNCHFMLKSMLLSISKSHKKKGSSATLKKSGTSFDSLINQMDLHKVLNPPFLSP
jgi:hypothetical protein